MARNSRNMLDTTEASVTKKRSEVGDLIVIDARTDAAYIHDCCAYVSPPFSGSGVVVCCARCGRTV